MLVLRVFGGCLRSYARFYCLDGMYERRGEHETVARGGTKVHPLCACTCACLLSMSACGASKPVYHVPAQMVASAPSSSL